MFHSKSPLVPTASVFARVAWLVYTLLIVYASWYPFTGWRSIGVSALDYLTAPLPYYWTLFDVVTNIAGYMPFGVLAMFALYPRVRGVTAFVLVSLAGLLLSGTMEAVQTFLPSRVASNLDLLSNAAGALAGAFAGIFLTRTFLPHSHLILLRRRWFSREASIGLIMVMLWPLAQLYPQGYLFGHGQLTPILSDWLSDWLSTPIDLGEILRHGKQLTVEQYWLSEAVITACGLSGAILSMLCLARERAPKAALAICMVVAALLAKSLAGALEFSPEHAFTWLTPGAEGGLLLGGVMLSGLIFAPPVAQRRVAALCLFISLAIVNMAPENPYFMATLQTWVQGKFLNFNGAAQFLCLLWPIVTVWFLFHPMHRRKQE